VRATSVMICNSTLLPAVVADSGASGSRYATSRARASAYAICASVARTPPTSSPIAAMSARACFSIEPVCDSDA
jgi:hypothetical protein